MFAEPVGKAVEVVLHVVLRSPGEIAADLRPAVAEKVVQRAEEKVLRFRPAGFGKTGNEIVEPSLTALRERGGEREYLFTSATWNVFSNHFPLLFSILGN